MPEDLSKKYEAIHIANRVKLQKRVKKAYLKAIDKIFPLVGSIKLKDKNFNLNNYPVLKRKVKEALKEFHDEVELILVNGIKSDWELSLEKNVSLMSKAYDAKNISDAVKKIIFDPREKALESFLNIKESGLGLSDMVWKYTNQFQSEIEQGIYAGLSEGKSAAKMATEQKQYLQEPEKLFRRVRDADGKLVLSKAAKAFKPGQGVYRSSFKNAFRFTRTITNTAYRTADYDRWNAIPFVLGIDVKLSNNHPRFDICDKLVGQYPSTYKHTGFHTQCLCYAVPKLASPEDYDKYEDAILSGNASDYEFKGSVNDIPQGAKTWYKTNKATIDKYKSQPYFLRDNKKFFLKHL